MNSDTSYPDKMSEVRVHADFTVKDEESFLRDTRPMIEATQVDI